MEGHESLDRTGWQCLGQPLESVRWILDRREQGKIVGVTAEPSVCDAE